MDERCRKLYDDSINKTIEKEMTPDGDLLPPWKKYPDLPRASLGWKMGQGESYIVAWDKWANKLSREQLIEYFRKHSPIPVEWLYWVSYNFGDKKIIEEMISGEGNFDGIHWLEQQGLASYSEFKSWYENNWKKKKLDNSK